MLDFNLGDIVKWRGFIAKVMEINKWTLKIKTIIGGEKSYSWLLPPRALTKLTKEELVSYRLMGKL